MLRSIAVLLLIAMAIGARSAPARHTFATTEEPVEESTYVTLQEGTITVDIDSDLILTTSPEGESFTEPNPIELTEEPLPDSVIQQLERERAEEERARNPQTPEPDTDTETETEPATTTEQPKLPTTTTKRSFKFGATTLPPILTTTLKPEAFTTQNYRSEDTTEYEEAKTVRTLFGRQEKGDLDMAENRMQTTTDAPVQDQKTDSTSSPVQGEIFMAMTTDASLVEEQATPRGEAEPEESPLFRFFSTSSKVPVATEALPETTTVLPEASKEAEVTILPVVEESTELPLPSSTQAPESITEAAETTTVPAPSTTIATEPAPITARMELYLNAQPISISSVPETTTSTTSAPETTMSSSSAPETTTSTTSAPETTVSTYNAPETTTSTTSAPETTTSTTKAPETTTSTTKAPETTTSTTSSTTSTTPATTTTTPRPVLTRAPRVERIFNSDGVEVLYGYSSVVRTNRS